MIVLLFAALASLLILSGCSSKGTGNAKVDMDSPPPLPEETGVGEGDSGQPPALPSEQQSQPPGAPPGLPLFG
ncbi:hypothetical protein HYU17_03355 [Candidatus Woesearchaeota archaeon]|nr:hypothetical protein [Candidatus Woesearchaeota archaeon]